MKLIGFYLKQYLRIVSYVSPNPIFINMMKISRSMLFSLAIFCTFYQISKPVLAESKNVVLKGKTIYFDGLLDVKSADLILRYLKSGANKLRVRSFGGDAESGLRVGLVISELNINVEVSGYCMSACANYLFLAARSKSLKKNSILGFHGGLTGGPPLLAARNEGLEKEREKWIELYKLDDELFQKLGIDKNLIAKSYEITEPEKKETIYKFVIENQEFTLNDEHKALELIADTEQANKKFSLDIYIRNASRNKVYFPSPQVLARNGVRGLVTYPYPKNQLMLNELAKKISSALEVVGDFND